MEQHRSKPTCNACHGVMDPLGFALENFDRLASGVPRNRLGRHSDRRIGRVDRRYKVIGPADLRKALVKREATVSWGGGRR
jgi:hypothetical protein